MNRTIEGGGQTRPEESAMVPGIRYHYMDNLRALAMLAGIFFHAALAYSPLLHEVWLAADPQNSVALDAIAWFVHLFRMPLFFLIAGFFACYLFAKRGAGGLIRNRALRILAPFLIFLPLAWVALGQGIAWALANVDNPSPMLGLIAMMANVPDAPPPPVTTTHLWFLYNLLQFYALYLVLEKTGLLAARVSILLASTRFLVFGMPLLVLPAMLTQVTPHPAPEQFTPQLWSFGFFGVFFLVGGAIFRNQDAITRLRRYAPWMMSGSLLAYAVLFSQMPGALTLTEAAATQAGSEISASEVLSSLLESIIAVHMTLVCLVYGQRFLDRANATVRFIADSSYWVYIIHLPLLLFIQYLLLDTDWNLWIEFLISCAGTLGIGILSYALLVRWTPIGWLLNGRRDGAGKTRSKPLSTPRQLLKARV